MGRNNHHPGSATKSLTFNVTSTVPDAIISEARALEISNLLVPTSAYIRKTSTKGRRGYQKVGDTQSVSFMSSTFTNNTVSRSMIRIKVDESSSTTETPVKPAPVQKVAKKKAIH